MTTGWRRLAGRVRAHMRGIGARVAGAAAEEYNKEYEQALSVGTQAYVYGEPLLDMQRVFQRPDECDGARPRRRRAGQPVLTLHRTRQHQRGRRCRAERRHAVLDRVAAAQARSRSSCTCPSSPGRFNVVPLMTPYTENFANIGEGASGMLAPGNYVIAGRQEYAGEEEVQGMKVIHSPYDRAWIIQRTLVKSHEDLPNAVAIQAETEARPAEPLEKGRPHYQSPAPEKEVTTPDRIQGSRHPGRRRTEHLLECAGSGTEAVQASGRRQAGARTAQDVGIGPGKFPVNNAKLSAGTLAGLRAAVAAGPGQVTKELTEMFHARVHRAQRLAGGAGRHLRHRLLAEGDRRQDRLGGHCRRMSRSTRSRRPNVPVIRSTGRARAMSRTSRRATSRCRCRRSGR